MMDLPTQVRNYVDLTDLTLDGQRMPAVYVKSHIIRKNDEPGFSSLIRELEEAMYPGFFLTKGEGDFDIRLRWSLNRHAIWKSDIFYDSEGMIYRDVDAKGVGYTLGFPMLFLAVREPEMQNDMEMRGIQHHERAIEDYRVAEEDLHRLGIRVVRPVALVELFELVNPEGEIVERDYYNDKIGLNFDKVRPTISLRAMGTSARVQNLSLPEETHGQKYVKEIVDDAINLVSLEVGCRLKPADYAVWFVETMGRQLGRMHKNAIWTDFTMQIHQGLHNLTLDCRLADLSHYQTPRKNRELHEAWSRKAKEDPDFAWFLEHRFPSTLTAGEARRGNEGGERQDVWGHLMATKSLVEGVDQIYPLGSLKSEVEGRFEDAYRKER
jgi:hypothetical protein